MTSQTDPEQGAIARRFHISGRVQGVGYRMWAARSARRLGLDGWVRNRLDGSVELVAVGKPEAVEALLEACRQGPSSALVDHVLTTDTPGIVATGFVQKPTV